MVGQPQTINEEAGLGPNWVPLDGPPIIPGQMVAAPPASDFSPTNPKYLQGSIAPNFQHDGSFVDTGDKTTHVPKFDLMPLGPQQNSILATQISSTVRTTVENIPAPATPATADDDTIKLNAQTGTSYTVQSSDLNKLISLSNNAGGMVFLPPVAGSVAVAITNNVDSPFTSGNTVLSGSPTPTVATSTYVFTATNAIAVGDFMFLAIRNVASHLDFPSVQMSDNINGSWSKNTVHIDDPVVGSDTLTLFWVRNTTKINAGGSVTLVFVASYPISAFNPDVNEFWSMTGIKAAGSQASSAGLSSGSTIASGGVTVSRPTTFISTVDSNNGDLATQLPATSQGKAWTKIGNGGSTAARFNFLSNISSGLINDVYTPSSSGNGFIDILQAFVQAQSTDVSGLSTDFFCYVENTGAGSFNLISAAPIDGSTSPVVLGPNQGTLLLWDAATQAWYTERGMGGGGTDTDFYQTVQQAATSKTQRDKLNFLGPITATDNAGNDSTDIAVPDMVGDSGSGGTHGLVPAPGAGDAAAGKFLKASGAFAIPPTMIGDSGSGGTAGYAPAPGAGDHAAGKYLDAGGGYSNPGSNPAAFNTGLVYAIAAGYALG